MIRLLASRPSLRRPPRPLVNLGCGRRRHPDWTNCDLVPDGPDVFPVDVSRPLPFEHASCDAVYAAHVLEHLAVADAERFVTEIHRVLRPGGIVRLVVPDLEGIARAYLASLDRAAADRSDTSRWEHRWMTIEPLGQLVRDASGERHRWMYDRVSLATLLEDVGFREVRPMDALTSRIAGFTAACLDTDSASRPRKPDSLYVEGVKP